MVIRIMFVLLVAACGVILLLTAKNRELSADNVALHQRLISPVLGGWLPAENLRDIDDVAVDLHGVENAPRVIYVMDPLCEVCRASVPGVRSLLKTLEPSVPGSLLVVSTSSPDVLRTYRDKYELGDARFIQSDPKLHSQMGVRVVPTTIVSGVDGLVLAAHVGLLDVEAVDRILTATRSEPRRGVVEMPREEGS